MAKSPRQEADESTDGDEKKFVCPDCGEVFDTPQGKGSHRRWNHFNPWEDKEKLHRKYVQEGLSIPDIADEWDCGETTIEQWLDKHDIDTRDRGGHPDSAEWKDKETLERLYYEEGLSMREIADKYDVAYSTINNAMKRNGVEAKDHHKPYHDKDWLLEHYHDKELTADEIADMFDTHEQTIFYHLRKHDIPRDYRERTKIEGHTPPYSYIHHREDGTNYYILVHRLVAYGHGILENGDLFNRDMHIHHKNGVKWINSAENLMAVTPEEHEQIHKDGIESDFI